MPPQAGRSNIGKGRRCRACSWVGSPPFRIDCLCSACPLPSWCCGRNALLESNTGNVRYGAMNIMSTWSDDMGTTFATVAGVKGDFYNFECISNTAKLQGGCMTGGREGGWRLASGLQRLRWGCCRGICLALEREGKGCADACCSGQLLIATLRWPCLPSSLPALPSFLAAHAVHVQAATQGSKTQGLNLVGHQMMEDSMMAWRVA